MLMLNTEQLSFWERMLDRYGWPAVFLALVLIAIAVVSKAIWPLLKAYVTKLQENLDASHEMLRKQLELANTRAERQQEEFISTLEKQRDSHESALRAQSESQVKALMSHAATHAAGMEAQTQALKEVQRGLEKVSRTIIKEDTEVNR